MYFWQNKNIDPDPPGFRDVAIKTINANSTNPCEFSVALQFQPITATFLQIWPIIVVAHNSLDPRLPQGRKFCLEDAVRTLAEW